MSRTRRPIAAVGRAGGLAAHPPGRLLSLEPPRTAEQSKIRAEEPITVTCEFDALCDFDRRIRTSESHEAENSHVIRPAGRSKISTPSALIVTAR